MSRPASVKANPDLTGYAPPENRWHAVDWDTYDGAPDSGPQIEGWGSTEEEALADWDAQLAEAGDVSEALKTASYLTPKGRPKWLRQFTYIASNLTEECTQSVAQVIGTRLVIGAYLRTSLRSCRAQNVVRVAPAIGGRMAGARNDQGFPSRPGSLCYLRLGVGLRNVRMSRPRITRTHSALDACLVP